MKNLVEFIKRYFHIILFFTLQVICIVLIYNNLHYPHLVIGKVAKSITYPAHRMWNGVLRHFNYRFENASLLQQNIELLREREGNFILLSDSTCHEVTIDEKNRQVRLFDYIPANVIYNTTRYTHNYLILDKGFNDSITTDMAVFSAQGIVGVINDVSANFCTVMSLLHPDNRVSAMIKPIEQIGTVSWSGHNPEFAYLHDIQQHLPVRVGDSVVTSGFSNVFPKDIPIGVISEITPNTKNSFYTIKIKLATNFNHINSVYIVKNLYKDEIDLLKANFKDE